MDLDKELLARIRAACASDGKSRMSDFQIRAGEVGTVLINLRTGKAQVVYDDDSPLHDMEDLNLPENVESSQRKDPDRHSRKHRLGE